jgi:hypothetical protein
MFYLVGAIRVKMDLFPGLDNCFMVFSILLGVIAWVLLILGCILGIVGNLFSIVLAFLCVTDPLELIVGLAPIPGTDTVLTPN